MPRLVFFALFLAVGASSTVLAQSTVPALDATHLGALKNLDTVWLVKAGDDLAYARPDFDDRAWVPFDPYKSIATVFGQTRPSVIWYRMRIKVDPTATGLALSEYNLSRAFEVYANGERLITLGSVAPPRGYTYAAHILASIPDRMVSSGTLFIALRVYIDPTEWTNGQNNGYYAQNLTIGARDTLYRANWLSLIGEHFLHWFDYLLLFLLGLVALVLFGAQKRQTEYLWVFALGMLELGQSLLAVSSSFYNVPYYWQALQIPFRLVSPFIWVGMYFSFVHQRIGWRWRGILIFAGVANALGAVLTELFVLPMWIELIGNLPYIVLLAVVIPVVLAIHLRRGNREAGILLIPVLLDSLYAYGEVVFVTMFQFPSMHDAALRRLNTIQSIPAGPFSINLGDVATVLSVLALTVIMIQRSTTMSRRQALLESELEAAQQVQQLLVPEHSIEIPGFTIESVYQPAQQVGGDFFQILPAEAGGLLVIVGDVAGKGLPAAMLVSVLVGATRALAEYTIEPGEMLASLNDRLVGRAGGGFSTALVAHIAADGDVNIANAGHLSPYLDGREVELPGALPLGLARGVAYETMRFHLAVGSRLTFYSDGVVEAQNHKRELLGFERSRELSIQPAAAIVEAAVHFGQCDDITVVTIARAPAVATAA